MHVLPRRFGGDERFVDRRELSAVLQVGCGQLIHETGGRHISHEVHGKLGGQEPGCRRVQREVVQDRLALSCAFLRIAFAQNLVVARLVNDLAKFELAGLALGEDHRVDVEGTSVPDHPQIELQNPIQQFVDEALVVDHGDQQVLHADQRPGPFEQSEAEIGQHEPIFPLLEDSSVPAVPGGIVWIRELVVSQILRSDQLLADVADVLVNGAIPLDTELIFPDVRLDLLPAACRLATQPGETVPQLRREMGYG